MQGPPPKPKGTQDDLAEVERALSVLKGRHPEHERIRREEEEAQARRRAARDAEASHALKIQLKRRARLLVAGSVAFVVLAVAGFFLRRELVRRGRLARSSDPYLSFGFAVVDTSSRGSAGHLEASVDPGCLLAVSTDPAPIEVTRARGSFKGPGPVLFCTCENEHVTLASTVESGGGLTLLRADAAVLGGSRAFAFAPFKPGTTARTDDACSDTSLDAWLDAKRFPPQPVDAAWLDADPARAPLVTAQAKALATIKPEIPFGVVSADAESCLVAMSDVATDKLSIRTHGGAQPFPEVQGAFAWCSEKGVSGLLQRDGAGTVTAFEVPATATGGLGGLRAVLERSGIHLGFAGLPPQDHAWNARQVLLASAVPEALVKTASSPEIAPDRTARLVALSFGTPNALTPESPPGVFSYCEPPITEATREALCIFSGEQSWRISTPDAVGGLARASLPFWLFGLEGESDPVALKAAADLTALARRLKQQRFEPTTIEAVTELPRGAEVLGRSGEDAVVVVGVMPASPWIVPYTDGPAWSITGEPRVVPLEPLATVTLESLSRLPLPKEKRRTVVFRRQAKP